MANPRTVRTLRIVAVAVGTFLVLCCGVGALAFVIDGGDPPNPATTTATTTRTPPPPTTIQAPTLPPPPPSATTKTTTVKPKTSTTTKKPTPTGPKTVPGSVTPGAFCDEYYWYGHTSTGKLMQCKPSSTDTRFRWRAA